MFDAIIAGAGPAGNSTANSLSRMGYEVAVLDWRQNLGDKLCTGVVGRECVERYPPDKADILREARSATVIAPSGRSHRVVNEEPQAYIIDRVAFVASLARRASEAGATYRVGENVVGIRCSEAGVSVLTSSPTGDRLYEARVLVIASGFASPLLRMVGLGNGHQTDYMIGCQAVVEANDLEDAEVYLGEAISPGSFGWLVPVSGSEALLGLVSRQEPNGHMHDFLQALQQAGKVRSVTKEPKRWGIPIQPLPVTYRNRVIVVGDAAGFVKPATGGGIYYALLSGDMAADTVIEAFEADDFSARRLKRYEARWKAAFGRELRIGHYARRLYEALGDDQIERLLNRFLSAPVSQELMSSKEFSLDWHSGVILKTISHQYLGNVLASFGPVVAPFLSRLSRSRSSKCERPLVDDARFRPSAEWDEGHLDVAEKRQSSRQGATVA